MENYNMKRNAFSIIAALAIGSLILLPALAGCQSATQAASDGTVADTTGTTTTTGSTGSTGTKTSGSSGTTNTASYVWSYEDSAVSGIPVTKTTGVARPSGTECNLKVLDWAGFTGAASYTFDDSQPSQIAHWSELSAPGVRLTFFAISSWNFVANRDTVLKAAIAKGCEIGNHTRDHFTVAQSGDAAGIAAQLDDCNKYITSLGQSSVWSMAFPNGDSNWKNNFGGRFLFGRSVNYGFVSANGTDNPLCLPTWCIDSTHKLADFKAQLDNATNEKKWMIMVFHSLLPTSDNWYAGVPVADVASSMTYAKNGGKIWVDSMVNVGCYWLGERIVAGLTPTAKGTGYEWTWKLPANFPSGKYIRVTVGGGTLSQKGAALPWNEHGFYEVLLDAGALSWAP
jgi:hypothetical protein